MRKADKGDSEKRERKGREETEEAEQGSDTWAPCPYSRAVCTSFPIFMCSKDLACGAWGIGLNSKLDPARYEILHKTLATLSPSLLSIKPILCY